MKNNQTDQNANKLIVFYDGYCILCNRIIDFVIKYDKKEKILFASLQSDFAISALSKFGYEFENSKKIDNVIYLQNTIMKTKSDAILSRGCAAFLPKLSRILLNLYFIASIL